MLLYWESFLFAVKALKVNGLRTLLSLLGVTIGIFAIVMVFTAVDSLEREIRSSMSFLGDKVLYVQKWPWVFKPGFAWWKYVNRPKVSREEFEFLQQNLTAQTAMAMVSARDGRTVEAGSSSFDNTTVRGVTYEYDRVSTTAMAYGRYFNRVEVQAGQPVAIIGSTIAQTLFGNAGAAQGRKFSYRKRPFTVIGVMKVEGKTLIGTPSNDNTMLVPFEAFKRVQPISGPQGAEVMVILKGRPADAGLAGLESEVRMLMRRRRSLKPWQDDSFAINRPEMLSSAIDSIFAVFTIAGAIIGSFSILVGGFGIANIMFVSVRERQNQIGIQKALGARRSFILSQFLFEAVLLALAGGAVGVLLVYGVTLIPQTALPLSMTMGNVRTGFTISALVGIVSGLLPALTASRLDPVEAIRG